MGNSNSAKTKTENNVPTDFSTKLQTIPPPQPFMTEGEFFATWSSWKLKFLEFKKSINDDGSDKNRWGNRLLNLMGPIGQDIYKTFVFNRADEKENIDVLIEKFDDYRVFSGRKKQPHESSYEYIDDLQFMVKLKNIKNGEELIKLKILTEINKQQFETNAKTVLPTFTFSSNFKNLTFKEIAFIWNLYDDNGMAIKCYRCGNKHGSNRCPASGKQCPKCKEWNHFSNRCPMVFNLKCRYCKGSHFNGQCPAYGETCTKCHKISHFSWACESSQVLMCRFCGLSHSKNRSVCPANHSICTSCDARGHFASQCRNKLRYRRK
ncbi:uncharacterized protein LOC128875128 isoform X1 [Hylaeus volcanicus]|uniref:uncharacterized protein LOC128875128 isoform X1 n=1 Tax=Hylaeus volcanicus TaxID=313075 RepID=UPI0023B809D8|nr:uncharacterized protein LOC128875128 isoform X1 [Hylaeus volcanicus]